MSAPTLFTAGLVIGCGLVVWACRKSAPEPVHRPHARPIHPLHRAYYGDGTGGILLALTDEGRALREMEDER